MRKRKVALIILLGTILSTAITYAITPLVVQSVLLPAIGQNQAIACDTDGASITYTYGPTRNTGIKVIKANVTGVSTSCGTVTVVFIDGTTEVASFSGTNTTGSVSITTTDIWTNDFTDVRVVLIP